MLNFVICVFRRILGSNTYCVVFDLFVVALCLG